MLGPHDHHHYYYYYYYYYLQAAVALSEEDMEVTLDLRRYMDPAPFAMVARTPLPRVYRLFNEIGARHLVVVNDNMSPIGMVTRGGGCQVAPDLDDDSAPPSQLSPSRGAGGASTAAGAQPRSLLLPQQAPCSPPHSPPGDENPLFERTGARISTSPRWSSRCSGATKPKRTGTASRVRPRSDRAVLPARRRARRPSLPSLLEGSR